jgi:hypothetical protein
MYSIIQTDISSGSRQFLLIASKDKAFRTFALVFAKTVLMAEKKVRKGKSKLSQK